MAQSTRKATLTEVAYLNLKATGMGTPSAMVNASRAVAAICAWAIAYQDSDSDEWPTQVEYARYWKVNERTVRRELDRFCAAFPSEESPERLARHLLSEMHGRRLKRDDFSPGLSARAPDWALPAAA